MSKQLLIIRGGPASGKTTWLKEHGLLPYTISPDDIRQELYNGELGDSQVVWKYVQERVLSLLFEGEFFVLDAQDSLYSMWTDVASKYGYEVWLKVMTTPRSECFKRNAARDGAARLDDCIMMMAFDWLEQHPIPDGANILPDDADPIKFFNLEKEPNWEF